MVHLYLGFIAYGNGDYDEANREFRCARLADLSKPDPTQRDKCAFLHYWLAKSYLKLGDAENALVALRKGRTCERAEAALKLYDLDRMKRSNLTVVVQMGASPVRVLEGADWQRTALRPVPYPERGCDLYLNGQKIGPAVPMADLEALAMNQGESKEQDVQTIKGVAKTASYYAPYVGYLAAIGWDVRGDIRSWASLPGRFFVWTGPVAPGEHTLTAKFYDASDLELTRYRQTWYYLPVMKAGESLLVLRASRDKCNAIGSP